MRGAGVEVEVAEEAAAAPTIVLLLPSPYPGTTRKAGGWRAGRETHPEFGLGLIFRKKGKESGKGAPRRRCKGWEWCLEKRRG